MPSPLSAAPGPTTPMRGAQFALILLFAINLFNYIDRQVLSAVLSRIQVDASIFDPADPWLQSKLGLLSSAFLVSYTLLSPVFGWFGNIGRRWVVVGVGVILWSIASASSGLATTYLMLLLTRCCVGIGEAAYGPIAPSMLSDMYPVARRGKILAWFYMAIPVGSALGFVIGGQLGEAFGWRIAFLSTAVGVPLGLLCFFMREPPRPAGSETAARRSYGSVLRELRGIRSFVVCCAGMTCTTFVLGGVAFWAPTYIFQREAQFEVSADALQTLAAETATDGQPLRPPEVIDKLRELEGGGPKSFAEHQADTARVLGRDLRIQYGEQIDTALTAKGSMSLVFVNLVFGVIVIVSGLGATLLGAIVADRLRDRGVSGAYFKTAGWSTLIAWPFFVAMLFVPFPYAWGFLFVSVFFLFFNTGPANAIQANTTRSSIRSTAYAVNILVIHLFGDVISPPIMGFITEQSNRTNSFLFASIFILFGGSLWVYGARFLDADTEKASVQV